MPCGGQPGTPFLYIPDSGPADHAAAACGPRGTKRSPKLLSSSRISRRQSINAHARGLSKESSGIRQNDKSGRNPGPYENCFQSGFLLLPSFPLVHPGNSDFRTLPSRQASRVQPEPRTYENCFQSGVLLLPSFPLVHPGYSDFRTLPCLSAGIASSRCPDPESRTVESDMEDLNALVCEALQAEAQQLVHPLTQRRRCGPPALLAARSAQRGSRCRPAATLWCVRSCAVHTSVVWASCAARATPPRPRPLSLSRSHGCCPTALPWCPPIDPRAATARPISR